jgi:hypothetical protein
VGGVLENACCPRPAWHPSCQNDVYWINVFGSYGFVYDEVTSVKLRKIAKNGFVAATAMFFTNSGLEEVKER